MPAEVDHAGEDDGEVDAKEGDGEDGVGDRLYVFGEGGEKAAGSEFFELVQGGGEDGAAEAEAEVVDGILGEADQEKLGEDGGEEGEDGDAGEVGQGDGISGDGVVDQADELGTASTTDEANEDGDRDVGGGGFE